MNCFTERLQWLKGILAFDNGSHKSRHRQRRASQGLAVAAQVETLEARKLLSAVAVQSVPIHGGGVDTLFSDGSVYFSPDGKNLGGGGSTIRDTSSGHIVQLVSIAGGVDTLFGDGNVFFSPDGKHLGGGGNTIRAYNGTGTIEQIVAVGGGIDSLYCDGSLRFSPKGQNLNVTTNSISGVSTLLQSQNSTSLPVSTILRNGQLQQSFDGLTYSTIDLGRPLTSLAQVRNANGQQVLLALGDDGILWRIDAVGSTYINDVSALLQSQNSAGLPVATILRNGQLQQSFDGRSYSTIDLGRPLTSLAQTRNPSGQQVLLALGDDGILWRIDAVGSTYINDVRALLQSQNSAGLPVATILRNGQLQQSFDGLTYSTIDLGRTLTSLAQVRNANGQQVLLALGDDGILWRIDAVGSTYIKNVSALLQSQNGAGLPVATILRNGQLQQSFDGLTYSTIDLGRSITSLAQVSDGHGQIVLLALRNDKTLWSFTAAGTTFVSGVSQLAQSISNNGLPVAYVLHDGIVLQYYSDYQGNFSSVNCSLGPVSGKPWVAGTAVSTSINIGGGGGTNSNLIITGLPNGLNYSIFGNSIIITGTAPKTGGAYKIDVAVSLFPGVSWATIQGSFNVVVQPTADAAYSAVSSSLFGSSGPQFTDIHQGAAGDCWLMSSLAEVAARDPNDIINMFTSAGTAVENGKTVNLYRVRFYDNNGHTQYVTVDTEFPNGGSYYDQVGNGPLWAALVEKAYAEANGIGYVTTQYPNQDSYAALNLGDPSWALHAISGLIARDLAINPSNMAAAWNSGEFICLSTSASANDNLIVGDSQGTHAYAVVGYNPNSSTPFELYNPWGLSSTINGTITYNGKQVYGGAFYASASLISSDFSDQSICGQQMSNDFLNSDFE